MNATGRPLHAVIVGAGLMGRWHADAAARAGARVSAVVDSDPARAAALARRHPGAMPFPDLESAARQGPASVTHICTPLETHASLAARAITLGLHVVVEKPLAPDAPATRELLGAAERAGVLLVPTHQFLFQPGVLRLLGSLERLGTVRHLDAVACSAGAEGQGDAARDRIAGEILPHPLALFARLAASPLAEAKWQVQHPAPGEFRASTTLGAATASILVSMGGRPTANTLRITGERSTAHLDLFHGFVVFEDGAVSRARKVVHPFALSARTLWAAGSNLTGRALRGENAYPGLRELVRRFYAAASSRGAAPISAPETLGVAVARDAIVGLIARAQTGGGRLAAP